MDDLQALASKSKLGNKEKQITSDNPFTKFLMQVQNMVGKDVIGVTAVGLKVFFAASTYVNQRIEDLAKAILNHDTNIIPEILGDICFKDPLDDTKIATLANANFEPVFKALQIVGGDYAVDITGENTKNLPELLQSQSSLKLYDIISELQKSADTIDGSDSISQLLSAATDNAKELILAKINATIDFADTWTVLFASGHSSEEIAKLMMSPIFGIVSKYSKTNIFSDIIKNSSPKKAISFILGESQLSGVDSLKLKLVLGKYRDKKLGYTDNDCFINKLLFETYTEDTDEHKRGEIKLSFDGVTPIRRRNPLIREALAEKLLEKGSTERANIFYLFSDIDDIDTSLKISKLLADHIAYKMSNIKVDNSSYNDYQDNYDDEQDYNEEQWEDSSYEPFMYDDLDNYEEEATKRADFGEDEESVFKLSKKDLQKLYRYLTSYVIPKNTDIANLSNRETEIKRLQNYVYAIQPAVEEQQIEGAILGVNQGLKTNQYDFYSVLKRVENFVNKRWINTVEFATQNSETFNIIKFLEDPEYKQHWIDNYDVIKSTINILKLINTVPNFKAMFELNKVAYRYLEHSVHGKLNFKLADTLIKDPTQKLSEDEFNVLDKYTRDLLIMNWLFMRNINIKIPKVSAIDTNAQLEVKNWPGIYSKNIDGSSILEKGGSDFNLNSSEGLASYVNLFENWIVPYLKAKYNNAFTRNISNSNKFSKTYNQNIQHSRLSMDMMTIDSSEATKHQYSDILNDFNEIADTMIPEVGISIKDAVFLYNTIVYKNAFAQNGFTRLMETVNVRGNNALINDWAQFVADLDAGKYDLGDLDSESNTISINPDGSFNLGVLKGNINDLLYRLSFLESAKYKFNVKQEVDDNKAISQLRFVDAFEHDIDGKEPINVGNPDANDWVMEMPVFGRTAVASFDTGFKPSYANRYTYDSREVIAAITENIISRFGIKDKIKYITVDDINKAWAAKNNGEETDLFIKDINDYNRMLNSKAFIHKGQIYLIGDKLSNDTVLHEVLHLVFAGMKFNSDENIRKYYYDLLEQANNLVKSDPKLYKQLRARYNSDFATDFKEELLVYKLTDIFTSSLKKEFNGYQFTDNVGEFVINVLNNILETDIPLDTKPAKLGNTSLRDIAIIFKSKIMSYDSNPLSNVNINLDQKIKTLKRILIKAGEDPDKKNFIKYDC